MGIFLISFPVNFGGLDECCRLGGPDNEQVAEVLGQPAEELPDVIPSSDDLFDKLKATLRILRLDEVGDSEEEVLIHKVERVDQLLRRDGLPAE